MLCPHTHLMCLNCKVIKKWQPPPPTHHFYINPSFWGLSPLSSKKFCTPPQVTQFLEFWKVLFPSFISIRNNSGPWRNPWRTPDNTHTQSNKWLFTLTQLPLFMESFQPFKDFYHWIFTMYSTVGFFGILLNIFVKWLVNATVR